MATTIRYELPYDAPIERVAEMLGDPAFRERVCERTGALRYEVSVAPDGDTKDVRIEMVQPTSGVPGFAKKIVGDETTVVQEETWTSLVEADVTVTIPGKPGDMTGTAVLEATADGGTIETVEMTVKVRVPLVAGKLENLIGDLLLKALEAEHATGRDYLSG
jgi:uncharacterized protein YndB with AHSA1/START domain